jgi:hypothetical protein
LTVSLSDSISVNTLEAGTFIDSQNNSVTNFTDVGGNIQFVQDTKPLDSESDVGDTWFDTANQVLHIYYTVSSGVTGWVPTNKVVKEEFVNDFSTTTAPFFTDGSYSNSLSSTGSFSYDLEFLDSASNLSVDVTGKTTNENSYVNEFNTYGFSTTTTTNSNVSNESLTVTGKSTKDTSPYLQITGTDLFSAGPSVGVVTDEGNVWNMDGGPSVSDRYANEISSFSVYSGSGSGTYCPETQELFASPSGSSTIYTIDVSDLSVSSLSYSQNDFSLVSDPEIINCTNDGKYLVMVPHDPSSSSGGTPLVYNTETGDEYEYPSSTERTLPYFNANQTRFYEVDVYDEKRITVFNLNGTIEYSLSTDYYGPIAEVQEDRVLCSSPGADGYSTVGLVDRNGTELDSYTFTTGPYSEYADPPFIYKTWVVAGKYAYTGLEVQGREYQDIVLFEVDGDNLIYHGVLERTDDFYYEMTSQANLCTFKTGEVYAFDGGVTSISPVEVLSQNVSVNVDSTEVASYDTLASSKNVSGFNIPSNSSVTFEASSDGEPIDVSFTWDEDIITTDPSVTINGNTTTYNGEVANGTTVTISPNESDLQADSNTVDIDTSLGSITSASYSHDAVASPRSDLNTTVSVDGSNLTASQDGDTVYIEPRLPASVSTWSLADYFADGGSGVVNVYLQQLSGGTWSRVNSGNPIPQDFDISSLDTTKNLRFEVVFVDAATATQTLQFVSRVYTQE